MLQRALEATEAFHEKQDEIENPTDASDRTVEVCEAIEQAIGDAIDAIGDAIVDLTP